MLENPASDGIDVADSNAAYYYHFDGLGSVVALSDSDGDSCQSYEYSAYGQVAAEDPNFIANPYMFTGRRFDIETGLYYYRARYYNPHIGRFMQTDPVGYGYAYCGNNPVGRADPSGLFYHGILDRDHELALADKVTFACFNDDDSIKWIQRFDNIEELIEWRKNIYDRRGVDWRQDDKKSARLSNYTESVYWDIMTLIYLNYEDKDYKSNLHLLDDHGKRVKLTTGGSYYVGTVYWNPSQDTFFDDSKGWHYAPPLSVLAHELGHAYAAIDGDPTTFGEGAAMDAENVIRYTFYKKIPGYGEGEENQVWARPAYGWSWAHPNAYPSDQSHLHQDISWVTYLAGWEYPDI